MMAADSLLEELARLRPAPVAPAPAAEDAPAEDVSAEPAFDKAGRRVLQKEIRRCLALLALAEHIAERAGSGPDAFWQVAAARVRLAAAIERLAAAKEAKRAHNRRLLDEARGRRRAALAQGHSTKAQDAAQ